MRSCKASHPAGNIPFQVNRTAWLVIGVTDRALFSVYKITLNLTLQTKIADHHLDYNRQFLRNPTVFTAGVFLNCSMLRSLFVRGRRPKDSKTARNPVEGSKFVVKL